MTVTVNDREVVLQGARENERLEIVIKDGALHPFSDQDVENHMLKDFAIDYFVSGKCEVRGPNGVVHIPLTSKKTLRR